MEETLEREFFEIFARKMGECAREAASRNAGLILKDLRTAIAAAEHMGEDPIASGASELTAVMKMEVLHPNEGKALVRVRSFAWTRKTTRCDKDFSGELVDMRQPELSFEEEEGEKTEAPAWARVYLCNGRECLPRPLPPGAKVLPPVYDIRLRQVEEGAKMARRPVLCPVVLREDDGEGNVLVSGKNIAPLAFARYDWQKGWAVSTFADQATRKEAFLRLGEKDGAVMYDLKTARGVTPGEGLEVFPDYFIFLG